MEYLLATTPMIEISDSNSLLIKRLFLILVSGNMIKFTLLVITGLLIICAKTAFKVLFTI
jgi:hypothetical protein